MISSFFYYYSGTTQVNKIIHGEKWECVGCDGRNKMIFLYFNLYILKLFSVEANQVSD